MLLRRLCVCSGVDVSSGPFASDDSVRVVSLVVVDLVLVDLSSHFVTWSTNIFKGCHVYT